MNNKYMYKAMTIAGSDTSKGLNYVFNPKIPSGDNMNHFLWGELDNVKLGEVGGLKEQVQHLM